ncbi:MAG: hypothetical protein AAB556_02140 [Patescibacteria group bacterium]
MFYFLHGPNSFLALKKIKEIKSLFLKKSSNLLIEEIDGEEGVAPEQIYGAIHNSSILSGKKLFILKNIAQSLPGFSDFLEEGAEDLKNSKNFFVFWERDIKKGEKTFSLLEKHAEKVQEAKPEEISEVSVPRNEIFRVVGDIFSQKGLRVILVLQRARMLGIIPRDLVNVIFWNFKRKSKISQKEAGLAYETLLADMNLKMDSKNETENLERLALSISKA